MDRKEDEEEEGGGEERVKDGVGQGRSSDRPW